MTRLACALILLLLSPQNIGEVDSSFDKKADFSTFRTYAWNRGHQAYDPTAHKIIVDAIEAQMTSLGYTKVDQGKSDVVLKYHTVRGSDVDLEQLEKWQKSGQTEPASEAILGSLLVVLYRTGSTTPLWEARTRQRLSQDAGTRTHEIQRAVASLFETYPGRRK